MPETAHTVTRALTEAEATTLVGTPVATDLDPTLRSPTDGHHLRITDADTGATVALITRMDPAHRRRLRSHLTAMNFGHGVLRSSMSTSGAVFGYTPKNATRQTESCRTTALARDNPAMEDTLEAIATHAADQYRNLHPDQAKADDELLSEKMLDEWRIGQSTYWTSGVINDANLLPYHRDGNNFPTWSAMPSIRYGMAGGHLHIPEYDLVFPVSDGDITWFYGRGLVHGVTPMRRRKPDAYRYTVVFYALRGMANCATYAEETRTAALRRTERERAEAARIRAERGLSPEESAGPH